MRVLVTRVALLILFSLVPWAGASPLSPLEDEDWGLKIVIFDVGQADAALFLTPDGEAALIDIGETRAQGKNIAAYLLNSEPSAIVTLKLLFCSHYDGDHIGGAAGLDGTVKVQAAYDQGPSFKREPDNKATLYAKYVSELPPIFRQLPG